jgi:hypothetical protein
VLRVRSGKFQPWPSEIHSEISGQSRKSSSLATATINALAFRHKVVLAQQVLNNLLLGLVKLALEITQRDDTDLGLLGDFNSLNKKMDQNVEFEQSIIKTRARAAVDGLLKECLGG